MSAEVVAKRYADALFQLGNEQGKTEQLAEELRVLKEVFQSDDKLNTFLKHPRVNNEKKNQLIDEAFKGFSSDVVSTLKILLDRQRLDIVTSIVDHFIYLTNDAKGIAEATVYSVRKFSDDEMEKLEKTFAKRLNKEKIKLENIVDPSVIGGVKLRVGNTIYDGTIYGKLQRIERDIVTAN